MSIALDVTELVKLEVDKIASAAVEKALVDGYDAGNIYRLQNLLGYIAGIHDIVHIIFKDKANNVLSKDIPEDDFNSYIELSWQEYVKTVSAGLVKHIQECYGSKGYGQASLSDIVGSYNTLTDNCYFLSDYPELNLCVQIKEK